MIHQLLQRIKDWHRGIPFGISGGRSPQWSRVEKEFKITSPNCSACGTNKKIEIHHCLPFHEHPELELTTTNLISLCRSDHFLFGHLNCWTSYNKDVKMDCEIWKQKIIQRPQKK